MISFEDFQKLDIRIGKIIEAEVVPDSRKLLKIKVDLGTETRQVLSGIAKEFTTSELTESELSPTPSPESTPTPESTPAAPPADSTNELPTSTTE